MKSLLVVLCVAVVSVGCRDDSDPPRSTDTPRVRRLIRTPPGKIRAVPPHAIHAGGVGPYKLGALLNDALDLVSGGPRVVVLNFEGVVDSHYIPAEEGTIIIGASRSEKPISFISILDAKIAKTKSGLSVGASMTRLEKELGKPNKKAAALRDPRIVTFDKFPTIRFVVTGDKVRAAMISGAPAPKNQQPAPVAPPKAPDDPPAKNAKKDKKPKAKPKAKLCKPGSLAAHEKDILVEAGTTAFSSPQVAYGCFAGDEPSAMVRDGDRITIVVGEPGKFRVQSRTQLSGTTFAAVMDINRDRRHEIAVTRVERNRKRMLAKVEVFRVEGNRLQRLASKAIYILMRETVEWTGVRLADVQLLLELAVRNRKLEVGGLFLHNGTSGARMMAPLLPVVMKVRSPRPPLRPRQNRVDAGAAQATRDAGVGRPRKRLDAGAKSPRLRKPRK